MAESDPELPAWAADMLKTLPPMGSVDSSATAAGLSSKLIRRQIAAGKLEVVRVGDRVLIPRLSLVRFLVGGAA